MNQEIHNNYDEISLRELIETLLNQKALIAIITIACILAAFVVSFFVMSPVYESKAVLIVTQTNDYPKLTIQEYMEQVNNATVMQEVITELKLDEQEITRSGLRNMISVETKEKTNLIEIKVENSDKFLATNIANTVSKKASSFIDNMIIQQYKTQLVSQEENIRAKMGQVEEELKNTPPKIELRKALSDDILLSQIANESDMVIITEEKNNYYYELDFMLSNLRINLTENLEKQNKLINKNKNTENQFETIMVVSPAVEPLNPVSPNKPLNLAIGGVLGLMIGVFIAFFREYWKNSAVEKTVSG